MTMYNILIIMAILPVVLLCGFIYIKDTNKEPFGLLAKLFFLGVVMACPVIILELIFGMFFTTDGVTNFIYLFISVFISVALIEEGAKWVIAKFIGYDDKEFDEIYDIIVYSVFTSLGFACIENVLYVLNNGFYNAITRALLAVPGHMCFGVLMGYFLAMAKINSVNNRRNLYIRNIIFSILVPALVHTMYDALIFISVNLESDFLFIVFLVFDINMVVVCFITVAIVSRMQVSIKKNYDTFTNLSVNTNANQAGGNNNGAIPNNVVNQTPVADPVIVQSTPVVRYCPICGKSAGRDNFCGRCGYKLK